MQQLFSVWNALDARRQVIVAITTMSVFALVLMLARVASSPSMALLYAGLEPSVSGEVVSALEQRGIVYSVQGNAIYVDSGQRDLMRMALAEEGLPSSGSAGYELLDNLAGFGTTAQMFDAAYWRAKEGELARTVLAWPQIKTVRVHIANPVQRPFSQSGAPVASVTVKMSAGALSGDRARALRFLVASAVSGLSPDDVSIIDSDRGLISAGDKNGAATLQGNARSTELKNNVERLLAARVGPGNVIVELSIDTISERETLVERRFDPDSRVAISTDTEEISGNSSDSGNNSVTVASNLPDGDAAAGAGSSKNSNTETRERINYEVSEITRELIKQPGRINRISVAVLVNGLEQAETNGAKTWTPRSEEELESLRDLVQSAIGFNAERGDIVTIKSLEFQPIPESGTLVAASVFSGFAANSTMLLQTGALTIVILGLGMFVVRPILLAKPVPALPEPEALMFDNEIAVAEAGLQLGQPISETSVIEEAPVDPIAQLRQIISERQDETVEVLRNWIETSEEHVS